MRNLPKQLIFTIFVAALALSPFMGNAVLASEEEVVNTEDGTVTIHDP